MSNCRAFRIWMLLYDLCTCLSHFRNQIKQYRFPIEVRRSTDTKSWINKLMNHCISITVLVHLESSFQTTFCYFLQFRLSQFLFSIFLEPFIIYCLHFLDASFINWIWIWSFLSCWDSVIFVNDTCTLPGVLL